MIAEGMKTNKETTLLQVVSLMDINIDLQRKLLRLFYRWR